MEEKQIKKSYPLLLEWLRMTPAIDNTMIYKKAAENQWLFVRDDLCRNLLKVPCFVVGTHMSKSIMLPVYRFELDNGIEITMRENFYGWVVSLKSPFVIRELPLDIVSGDGDNKCDDVKICEGFNKDWIYPFYKYSVRLSTFRVSSDYGLYTLMYMLNKLVNENKENDSECLLSEELVKICVETVMSAHSAEHMKLDDLFLHSFYAVNNYDYCQQNDIKMFFCDDENAVDEFAKRIVSSEEMQKIFHNEFKHLSAGFVEENKIIFN